jgi:prevent-host-death family protein
MRSVQVRDAKAGLSALLDAALQGSPTTITRHGVPTAVLIPVEDAQKLYSQEKRSYEDFILSFPGGIEFERDQTPMRDIDL